MNLFSRFRHAFAKANPAKSGEAVSPNGATIGLFDEVAVNDLVKMLTRMPDPDEVLRQAGIRRTHLRTLTFDDEIAQACETRLDALLGVPIRFEPNDGAEAIALTEIMAPLLADATIGAFQARLFGYSVLEAVYYPRADGAVGLAFLGEKPFEWFEPKSDGRLMFFPASGGSSPEGIEVDQTYKFFLTRSRATYRNPYGDALLSKLYWPWFFRQNGWKFWAKFLERFGAPLLVGKSADPTAMVGALLQAHSQAVIGIDLNDSVETIGSSAGSNGAAFETFEGAIIRRIQKVILGQTLTSGTDGGSGTRALGQVHDGVRLDKRNSDIALVQPTLQRIVDAVCTLNRWKRHIITFADEVGLEGDRAKRDNDLYTVGVRFEKPYFENNYALRGEDFTLESDAPAVGGAPTPTPRVGGDAKPSSASAAEATPKSGQGAKASKSPPRLFSQGASQPPVFTPAQQVIEQVGATGLSAAGLPLSSAKLRSAVLAATSPEDLEERLFALVGESLSDDAFRTTLEAALYSADVIGYVHSEGNVS